MFNDRLLLIATKHEKSKVLAPLLERALSVQCLPLSNFDTDTLGTFSGEVERKDDPLTTLRKKCMSSAEAHGVDLVIATEGSFGPHPIYASVPANDELIMLLDLKNNLELVARELNTKTNYGGAAFSKFEELLLFAYDKGFPQHGLILKDRAVEFSLCTKGIRNEMDLQQSFKQLKKYNQSVWAETDMRAHMNPTRMEVIELAAHKLIKHLKCECPHCKRPGFIVKRYTTGLLCALCGSPTPSIKSEVKICDSCSYEEVNLLDANKTTADPIYCLVCNP